jgi:hypothetical protein
MAAEAEVLLGIQVTVGQVVMHNRQGLLKEAVLVSQEAEAGQVE